MIDSEKSTWRLWTDLNSTEASSLLDNGAHPRPRRKLFELKWKSRSNYWQRMFPRSSIAPTQMTLSIKKCIKTSVQTWNIKLELWKTNNVSESEIQLRWHLRPRCTSLAKKKQSSRCIQSFTSSRCTWTWPPACRRSCHGSRPWDKRNYLWKTGPCAWSSWAFSKKSNAFWAISSSPWAKKTSERWFRYAIKLPCGAPSCWRTTFSRRNCITRSATNSTMTASRRSYWRYHWPRSLTPMPWCCKNWWTSPRKQNKLSSAILPFWRSQMLKVDQPRANTS